MYEDCHLDNNFYPFMLFCYQFKNGIRSRIAAPAKGSTGSKRIILKLFTRMIIPKISNLNLCQHHSDTPKMGCQIRHPPPWYLINLWEYLTSVWSFIHSKYFHIDHMVPYLITWLLLSKSKEQHIDSNLANSAALQCNIVN